MHHAFNGYDTIIFDCDGVILDSNNLKIEAMRNSLRIANVPNSENEMCCDYFKKNFGKSRFHHVQYFVDNIISFADDLLYEKIISNYAKQCESLYLSAKITPGFLSAISNCSAKLFVASGSAQEELREVFRKRNLGEFFTLILGSPTSKSDNIATILAQSEGKALMIGDAISDFNAARDNGIDFLAYLPFSNVKDELENLATREGYPVLRSW